MTLSMTRLIFAASFTVALANAEEALDDEHDEVAFLQAEVLTRSGGQEHFHPRPAEPSQVACESFAVGYKQPVGELSCASKAINVESPIIEADLVAPSRSEEPATATPGMPEAHDEDPPGAATLKAVLELGVIFLFFDGLRRWHLQSKEKDAQRKQSQAQTEEDEAADRAWAEMVKAAALGDVPNFKKALQHKPSVRREDPWGCTPLHFAATGGSTEVTADLLKRGAKVDAVDACDETALHFAARAGHTGVCEVLLNEGASVNAINAQDMTPFVVAGHAKQASTCRILADHGGNAGGLADEELPLLVVSQLVRKVFEGASEAQ